MSKQKPPSCLHTILLHFQERATSSPKFIRQSYIAINCRNVYQILNKLFECLKAPKNHNSVIKGLHPILAQPSKILNRQHQLVHSRWIFGILSSLYSFDEVLHNGDLVECRRRTNHGDSENGLRLDGFYPNPLQVCIVMLKSGDCFRNELWFGIHFFQVPFVLLHKEKDPEVLIDHADISFNMRLSPTHEERYVFSLANEAISDIVPEQGEEMGGKIINGRFLPRWNRHRLFQVEEEVSIILVSYPVSKILFVVENHLMDGWLRESGISEESGYILGGDGDIVGMKFVFRPLRP